MKNSQEKDRTTLLITLGVSFMLAGLMLITRTADDIALAVASAMFDCGKGSFSQKSEQDYVSHGENGTDLGGDVIPDEIGSGDITRTPDDIKALIKKYTDLYADDKKDGDISSVTYIEKGATHIFENVRVKNTTETKPLDIESVLSLPLEIEIDKSKPCVLIFHSHTSEGYEMIERDWYAADRTLRSNDENLNIVRVGTEIADYLTKLGYTVIHDKTIHDDIYGDSYPNSRKAVEKHLEENPSIQIVLDIHRDSITLDNGTKIKPVNTIGGKKAAQLMIITGAEEGKVEDFPDWEYNLRFALQLQKKCETMFPGLMRPVLFSQRKYNMDMTRFSLLVEMGSEANTLEEACYSGRMLAAALASLMDEYEVNAK